MQLGLIIFLILILLIVLRLSYMAYVIGLPSKQPQLPATARMVYHKHNASNTHGGAGPHDPTQMTPLYGKENYSRYAHLPGEAGRLSGATAAAPTPPHLPDTGPFAAATTYNPNLGFTNITYLTSDGHYYNVYNIANTALNFYCYPLPSPASKASNGTICAGNYQQQNNTNKVLANYTLNGTAISSYMGIFVNEVYTTGNPAIIQDIMFVITTSGILSSWAAGQIYNLTAIKLQAVEIFGNSPSYFAIPLIPQAQITTPFKSSNIIYYGTQPNDFSTGANGTINYNMQFNPATSGTIIIPSAISPATDITVDSHNNVYVLGSDHKVYWLYFPTTNPTNITTNQITDIADAICVELDDSVSSFIAISATKSPTETAIFGLTSAGTTYFINTFSGAMWTPYTYATIAPGGTPLNNIVDIFCYKGSGT